jgi:transcriptional regulator with XRE-family HTH domain
MDAKLFGKNVLVLRKARKLSQEQLAKLAEVSRNYISMIERGEAENVSEVIIQKLAGSLEVPTEQLINDISETSGTMIPPALREFALGEGLSFKTVDKLKQIPFRGKEPTTAEEWKDLYEAIKPFISGE